MKAVVVVPIQDNNGKPFTRTDWEELEQRLVNFGGATRTGEVTGAWVDGGKRYDVNRQYISYLTWLTDLHEWLENVGWARVHFRQEAYAD